MLIQADKKCTVDTHGISSGMLKYAQISIITVNNNSKLILFFSCRNQLSGTNSSQ